MVADPAGAGLNDGVPAFGISTDVPLNSQLEIIAEALPNTRSIGMLYRTERGENGDETEVSKSEILLNALKAALPKDWKIEAVSVSNYESNSQAIQELFRRKVDIVWTFPDRSVYSLSTLRSLLSAAVHRKKPVFAYSKGVVKAGSLLGIAIEPEKQGLQAAELVKRLLSDGADSESENALAPQYEIAVNLLVAGQIGDRADTRLH